MRVPEFEFDTADLEFVAPRTQVWPRGRFVPRARSVLAPSHDTPQISSLSLPELEFATSRIRARDLPRTAFEMPRLPLLKFRFATS